MSPLQHYQQLLESGQFEADLNQLRAIQELERVYQALKPGFRRTNWFGRLCRRKTPILGLYLWGSVGIGKTWMMDVFHHSLPENFALRSHFHRFMRQVHLQLKAVQGKPNPLKVFARNFARTYRVLCFDEFFVSDITDAMLLGGLLEALFNEGVALVTTSNVAPDLLYKGGVNRDRFLPAIELIQNHTRVLNLPTQKDYRLRHLQQASAYYSPLNAETQQKMREHFAALTQSQWRENEPLLIEQRQIPAERVGDGIVWFSFRILCHTPRSQIDYIEIAKLFHTVFLSDVPKLRPDEDNETLYFINLVDIFYDAQVKLIIGADCPIDELYTEGRLKFEFERTKSRLQEMQSMEYLHKPHLV